jgi:hypothetical protein
MNNAVVHTIAISVVSTQIILSIDEPIAAIPAKPFVIGGLWD